MDREVCEGCNSEIDSSYCHCGQAEEDHGYYGNGHSFVPMGCVCGYPKDNKEIDQNKNK